MKQVYVYELISSLDRKVFYVGKGTKRRAYQHKSDAQNKTYKHRSVHRKIQSIISKGGDIIYKIYPHSTDLDALNHEKTLIEQHGRKDLKTGNLCNLTDGGEDGSNRSPQTIEKVRQLHLGSKRSDQARQNMSAAQKRIKDSLREEYGSGASPETKLKMSQSRKGKKWSDKAKAVKRSKPTATPIDVYRYYNKQRQEFVDSFESISDAARHLNLDVSSIWKILDGWYSKAPDGVLRPYNSHRGYTFLYNINYKGICK